MGAGASADALGVGAIALFCSFLLVAEGGTMTAGGLSSSAPDPVKATPLSNKRRFCTGEAPCRPKHMQLSTAHCSS